MKEKGHPLSYIQIMEKSSAIPRDSLEITLNIIKEKGWISDHESKTIFDFYTKEKK
jgi:hypothetical protein